MTGDPRAAAARSFSVKHNASISGAGPRPCRGEAPEEQLSGSHSPSVERHDAVGRRPAAGQVLGLGRGVQGQAEGQAVRHIAVNTVAGAAFGGLTGGLTPGVSGTLTGALRGRSVGPVCGPEVRP